MTGHLTPSTVYAPSPTTHRGEATSMSILPKGDKLVYPSGKLVVIRSTTDAHRAWLYTQHSCNVTAVAAAPNGEWVASGDERGQVRIWGIMPEHTLKLETIALGGKVLDIAWSGDGQRLCAVGEGREAFGKVFTWDSGNSLGAIDSHSKRIISCSFRAARPFRVATGSDDLAVNWYEGPPFKFKASLREHTRYPNCVRFSPDGEHLVSAGSDNKLVRYDGKTGQKSGEVAATDAHLGAIFSCSWSSDSKHILTASADKTARIFDAATLKPLHTVTVTDSPGIQDMQVSCCWAGSTAITLSLSGRLNFVDASAGKVVSSIMGHNKAITALGVDLVHHARYEPRFATASFDGLMCVWDTKTGECRTVGGRGHDNAVVGLAVLPGETLVSASLDQTVRFTSLSAMKVVETSTIQLDGSARGLSAMGEHVAVVSDKSVFVIGGGGKVSAKAEIGAPPTAVAISPGGNDVAVGLENGEIWLYGHDLGKLTKKGEPLKKHSAEVTALAFSPTGAHLASCCAGRSVFAWELASMAPVSTSWVAHKAKVTCLAWSPSGKYLASGGVDSSVIVWYMEKPSENTTQRLAHDNGVTAIGFVSEDMVISTGQDACVKTWSFKA